MKFGVTYNHILAAEVVLPDGSAVTFNVGDNGPDLLGVIIGSEGTLGIVTEVTVALRPIAPVTHSLMGAFATAREAPDRDVVIDIARPNPVVLAGLTRNLNRKGIHRIVRTTNQRGGEVEMATQVFNRHLVAVVSYAPDSFIGKMFSPPEFKLIPVDESTWAPVEIALAWVPERLQGRLAEIEAAAESIADGLGPVRRGA